MQQDGVRSNQVTQVRGYADQMLRVKNNPFDPSNRRISILVKNDNETVPTLLAANVVNGSTPLPGSHEDLRGGKEWSQSERRAAGRQDVHSGRDSGCVFGCQAVPSGRQASGLIHRLPSQACGHCVCCQAGPDEQAQGRAAGGQKVVGEMS
jgi:hypothetical protein